MKFSSDIALAVRELLRQDQNYVMSQVTKGGHGAIFGKVRWVLKSDFETYDEFLAAHPPYEDGSLAVYTTITLANAALKEGDVMIIAPGTYAEAQTTVAVVTDNVKIFGSGAKGDVDGSRIHHGSGSATLISIDANNVEIAYMNFIMPQSESAIAIDVANTSVSYGVHIHHCHFQPFVQTVFGIGIRAVNRDAVHIIVEHCFFHMGYRAIQIYATRSIIRFNDFTVQNEGCGIYHEAATSARAGAMIYGNNFNGHASGGYGINIPNTPNAECLFIHGNIFSAFADATHCCTKLAGYGGLNFFEESYLSTANPPVVQVIGVDTIA